MVANDKTSSKGGGAPPLWETTKDGVRYTISQRDVNGQPGLVLFTTKPKQQLCQLLLSAIDNDQSNALKVLTEVATMYVEKNIEKTELKKLKNQLVEPYVPKKKAKDAEAGEKVGVKKKKVKVNTAKKVKETKANTEPEQNANAEKSAEKALASSSSTSAKTSAAAGLDIFERMMKDDDMFG